MILLTVGTQLPFDRLTSHVDAWAARSCDEEIVAQIGPANYHPRNLRYEEFFDPRDLESLVASARLIISHAGMGSIISALTAGKPIIVVPRRADLGEHRNDHQIATARKFVGHAHVRPLFDLSDLDSAIDEMLRRGTSAPIPEYAPDHMISALRGIIEG